MFFVARLAWFWPWPSIKFVPGTLALGACGGEVYFDVVQGWQRTLPRSDYGLFSSGASVQQSGDLVGVLDRSLKWFVKRDLGPGFPLWLNDFQFLSITSLKPTS